MGGGRGGGAEVSLCAVSVPTYVLRNLALIEAKTFSKQVVIRIRKYELHFDIPWELGISRKIIKVYLMLN